jgi:hypothetical protein
MVENIKRNVMKKFITLLAAVMLCSCDFDTENLIPGSEKSLENDTKLIELTFEGHTHQFIFNHSFVGGYGGSYDVEIIHWPSCKYCKEEGNEN